MNREKRTNKILSEIDKILESPLSIRVIDKYKLSKTVQISKHKYWGKIHLKEKEVTISIVVLPDFKAFVGTTTYKLEVNCCGNIIVFKKSYSEISTTMDKLLLVRELIFNNKALIQNL